MQAENYQLGHYVPYTNSTGADLSPGDIAVLADGRIGIAPEKIANGATKSVQVSGVARVRNAAVAGAAGDNAWWDANGTPVEGTALSGALTTDATAGDNWMGTLHAALAATDEWAYIRLNEANPAKPAWHNKAHVKTAVDLTWAAATHNGKVIHVTADAKTVTLPTGVAGMEAIIVNDCADGTGLITVDFDGNETCEGNLAIAATKTALNTKATQKRGDFLHLRCQTAGSLWVCLQKRGVWAQSA